MSARRVLSVGQCFADHSAMARTLGSSFGADVVPAATSAEALDKLRAEEFALVLVNRILDADGSSGLDLIRQIKDDTDLKHVPVMLVSNYEDAQKQATAAGALPGFGKAALGHPRVSGLLKPLLG